MPTHNIGNDHDPAAPRNIRAVCTCGWTGPWRLTPAIRDRDANAHIADTRADPTRWR